ncbi:MAG: esterase-like activity of phytase family protein [Acidobacteriota bacterium]
MATAEMRGRTACTLWTILLLALAAFVAPGPVRASAWPTVSVLDHASLPHGLRSAGTCVGGLSALTPEQGPGVDPRRHYLAASDDARDPRLYRLDLPIEIADDGTARFGEVAVIGVRRLRTREGARYPDDRVDPEGLAMWDGSQLFLASAGAVAAGVPPALDRIDPRSGRYRGSLTLPPDFDLDDGGQRGTRINRGLEGLTLTPDRAWLLAALEDAPAQGMPRRTADPGDPHAPRPFDEAAPRDAVLLRYALEAIAGGAPVPRLADRAALALDVPSVEPADAIVVHGVTELLALDATRVLAIERTFARGAAGFRILLRALDWPVRDGRDHDAPLRLAVRTVLDVGAARLPDGRPVPLDNYEGLAFGPMLADGARTVIVLGDNDAPDCPPPSAERSARPTHLLLLRLDE